MEEPGETTDFRLIDVQGTTAWFGGLTLHRVGNSLDVYLSMAAGEGGINEVLMQMQRERTL